MRHNPCLRYDRAMSAYPEFPAQVVCLAHLNSLHLTRSIAAVRGRNGEDAEYIVGSCYSCVVVLKRENGEQCWHCITVPKGFLTDLSSVPWFLRWFAGRVGPHLEASVIHDWLFVAWQHEGLIPNAQMHKFADDVFLAAMKVAKVCRFRRWVLYTVSRVLGRCTFLGREDRLFAKDR